jgi:hypothetical protein
MPVVNCRYSVYNERYGQAGFPVTFTLIAGARLLDPELEIQECHGEVLSTYGIAPLLMLLMLLIIHNIRRGMQTKRNSLQAHTC